MLFWNSLAFSVIQLRLLRHFSVTLCDPIDGSPWGSPVPGVLQAITLEWVAISFSNAWKWKCGQFDLWFLCLSKTSLNVWKFTVHVLLKPGLENFEHYFTSVWNECNCVVAWTFFGIAFFTIGMKNELFQSCGLCWVFQIWWHIECSTFTASLFRIWYSSSRILSPLPALFIVMLPRTNLTLHSKMSGSRWMITSSWLSESQRSFLYNSSVYSCHLFLI